MDDTNISFKKRALNFQTQNAANRKSAAPQKSILRRRHRFKRWIQYIPTFLFGSSSQIYTKPSISPTEFAYILINMHVNFRSLCLFASQAIFKGPLFVTILYTLSHVLLCPPLCYLYGFLGRYGERSFINLWDMVPILQGISGTVCLFECYRMIETSILLSTTVMMLMNGYYTDYYMFNDTVPTSSLKCNLTSGVMELAIGIDYGASRLFNNIVQKGTTDYIFGLNSTRVYVVIGIWLAVLVIRCIKNKKFNAFIERGMPIILLMTLGALVATAFIYANDYDLKYTNRQSNQRIYNYMHTLAFSIADYLPSHWITIGYLNDRALTRTQVMGTSMISVVAGCGISYAIVFYTNDFVKAINADVTCYSWGTPANNTSLHFFIVTIPYSIRYRCGKLGLVLIPIYILIIIFKSLSYITVCHKLLMWAITSWKHWTFRFRHLINIATILMLGTSTTFMCTQNTRQLLAEINIFSIYHTIMIVFFLTLVGIGIYGLRRINADHLFLTESEYPRIWWLKFLLAIGLEIFLLYGLSLIFEAWLIYEIQLRNIVVLIVLLSPLLLGIIKTILKQKQYHGFIFYPLTTWGRAEEETRDERRRQNLRQMFIHRTSRKCEHNCLSRSLYLETEIYEELRLRQVLLETLEYEHKSASEYSYSSSSPHQSNTSSTNQSTASSSSPSITSSANPSIQLSDSDSDEEVFTTFKNVKRID